MNVLIISAGQRVSLVKSFIYELQKIDPTYKVYTADMNPQRAPACHICEKAFKVPSVADENYIDCLIQLCIDNAVCLIVPTIDTELLVLSENISKFQKYGIEVVISEYQLIQKCRDKRKTIELFNKHHISVPKIFDITAGKEQLTYPIFIKPYDGSLSKGIFLAHTADDIEPKHLADNKLMYMSYISPLEADEFTVDCYYDKNSILRCVVPRQRLVVRAGEVNKAITKKNVIVTNFFKNLKILPGAKGCLTIQVFLNKNSDLIRGIEINPRFGGGYPLTYLSGANYTRWLLEEYLLNKEIEVFNAWEDNLLMLRYDAEVIVHNAEES